MKKANYAKIRIDMSCSKCIDKCMGYKVFHNKKVGIVSCKYFFGGQCDSIKCKIKLLTVELNRLSEEVKIEK